MPFDVRFVGVEQLLESIGTGIGTAAKALVESSANRFNAMALKQADVQVQFELTSRGSRTSSQNGISVDGGDEAIPILGAKTLNFSSSQVSTESTFSNTCHIALTIVSVNLPTKDTEAPKVEPAVVLPGIHVPADLGKMKNLLTTTLVAVTNSTTSSSQKAEMNMKLDDVQKLLDAGQTVKAQKALTGFLVQYGKGMGKP
jgi:hypothetical protein